MKNQHGGNIDFAKKTFPQVRLPWLDLSTGINPYHYPISLDLSLYETLPLSSCEKSLRNIASAYYGCRDETYVAVAPGTQILIALLPLLLKVREVYVFCPTYGEHLFSWQQAGIKVTKIFDIDHFDALSNKKNTVAVFCNPNNPNGRIIKPARLADLIQKWGQAGNHFILDEAYMDFSGKGMSYLLPCPGLIILRSFGKTFGLAGLRVGFLLASPEMVQKIRSVLGSWSVNGPALQIASQALQDKVWKSEVQSQLQIQQKRLDSLLLKYSLRLVGGTLLFRLFYHENAQNLWEHLASHGIWVRKFDYTPYWLRFGMLHKEEEWQRLETVLSLKW